MARQLKTFLRNRKAEMLACGPCECRTLQCWRYANENCGCGDAATSGIGNRVYAELVDVETQVSRVRYFTTGKSGKDYISRKSEAGESVIELVGAFDSAGGQALGEIIFNSDYNMLFTFGKGGAFPASGAVGTIDADAMALVTKVFEDPSEENKQELTSFLETHMEAIQQGDANAYLVTYPVKPSITLATYDGNWNAEVSEQKVILAVVTPSDESITAVSSNPSILRVDSVEKNTQVGGNMYVITCTGMAAGTATITATCVNNPSVSATTPTIIVTGSGGGVNSISTHVETISLNETRSASVEVVVDPYTAPDVSFTAVSSDPNVLEIQNIIMYDEPTDWAVGHINVIAAGQGECNLVITSVANPNATVTVPVVVGQNIPVESVTPSSNSFTITTDTLAVPVTLTDWYVDVTPANATNINDDVSFYNDENVLGWAWISEVSAEGRITYLFNPVAYGTADYTLQCGENTQTISVTVAQPEEITSMSNLSASSATVAVGGINNMITVDYLPVDADDDSNVEFRSSDDSIAEAYFNGAVSPGTAIIGIEGHSVGTATISIYIGGVDTGLSITVTVVAGVRIDTNVVSYDDETGDPLGYNVGSVYPNALIVPSGTEATVTDFNGNYDVNAQIRIEYSFSYNSEVIGKIRLTCIPNTQSKVYFPYGLQINGDDISNNPITSDVTADAGFAEGNAVTVTINVDNPTYGSVDRNSIRALKGTSMSVNSTDNTILQVGSDYNIVTATAEAGCGFNGWKDSNEQPIVLHNMQTDETVIASFDSR